MANLYARSGRYALLGVVFFVLIGLYYLFTNRRLVFVHLNQINIAPAYRATHWDWKDTPEETLCRNLNTSPLDAIQKTKEDIPNIVHFVLLNEPGQQYELSYSAFLAIKAAILRMNATEIKIHTYHNGLATNNHKSPYWQTLSKHVTLIQHSREAVTLPGIPTSDIRIEHQSDILRLSILQREGGIYLDTDMYVLKPFTDLLSSPRDVLLGHEGASRYGFCNAVILARPHSLFLSKWQDTYWTFNPQSWNEHSVLMPKRLHALFPELVCPLSPSVFFWPTWAEEHVRWMFGEISGGEVEELRGNLTRYGGSMYANQLAYHAWGGSRDPGAEISLEGILGRETRFNVLMTGVAEAEL